VVPHLQSVVLLVLKKAPPYLHQKIHQKIHQKLVVPVARLVKPHLQKQGKPKRHLHVKFAVLLVANQVQPYLRHQAEPTLHQLIHLQKNPGQDAQIL